MFDLTGRVLRAHEAAMKTAHLVTFRGRVLVLELGLGLVGCGQNKLLG